MQNTKYKIPDTHYHRAFTLIEMVTSLIILALMCSSVLVVISRCVASAADSTLRMQAFEVTRENMEKLLASDSVSQTTEFGISDKFPEIKWQTTVESFYEPITARMWVKGVCSTEYTNTAGEAQTVELTHWLTDVTKEQLLKIIEEKRKIEESEEAEPDEPAEPNEPTEPNEPVEPDDEEQTWCGKTLEEIIQMPFMDLWTWDCPEFWAWIGSEK